MQAGYDKPTFIRTLVLADLETAARFYSEYPWAEIHCSESNLAAIQWCHRQRNKEARGPDIEDFLLRIVHREGGRWLVQAKRKYIRLVPLDD
jgi:hypothetical protein